MVRRLGTMLRVLDYYQVDKASERKMMEEMAGVLAGLSQNQMAEVISRLETAGKTKDENAASQEVQEAYDRHREILDTLKALLARHDAVRNLDQAADRLDKIAKEQLELHLQTRALIKDAKDAPDQFNLLFPPQKGGFGGGFGGKRRNVNLEPKRQADAQVEIHMEVDNILGQVQKLRPILPDDEQGRISRMQKLALQYQLLPTLDFAAKKLKTYTSPAVQTDIWVDVNEIQWQTAGQIKELARALRASTELLAALRETRDRVEMAIVRQDVLNQETKENQAKVEDPKLNNLDRAAEEVKALAKNRDLVKEQTRLEYDAKDTANVIKPHVEELAKELNKAENAMKDAREALALDQPKDAAQPQDKAAKTLDEIRKDLDQRITEAMKLQNDPLAALKKAADDLEKLTADQ